MSLVSIIMPAFNAENFIADSINSVISQTYSCWELIIVNDNSSDNTQQIIDSFVNKDERIIGFRFKYNVGAATARNHAINISKGRFIAFLDADDIWKSEKLEKQVSFHNACAYNKRPILISFTGYDIIKNGLLVKKYVRPKAEVSHSSILHSNYLCTSTVMLDRDELNYIPYMPNIKQRQDWALWIKILNRDGKKLYSRCRSIPELLATRQLSSSSLSSSVIRSQLYNILALIESDRSWYCAITLVCYHNFKALCRKFL